jgi:hypothetical protein
MEINKTLKKREKASGKVAQLGPQSARHSRVHGPGATRARDGRPAHVARLGAAHQSAVEIKKRAYHALGIKTNSMPKTAR